MQYFSGVSHLVLLWFRVSWHLLPTIHNWKHRTFRCNNQMANCAERVQSWFFFSSYGINSLIWSPHQKRIWRWISTFHSLTSTLKSFHIERAFSSEQNCFKTLLEFFSVESITKPMPGNGDYAILFNPYFPHRDHKCCTNTGFGISESCCLVFCKPALWCCILAGRGGLQACAV